MKTNKVIFTAALAAAVLTTAALAQNAAPAPSPAANEIVYVPQLPSPSDLTGAASAQGLSVVKIDQTSDGITATYRTSTGQMSVISYKPISAAEAGGVGPAPAQASGPAVASTTVVYDGPGPYYYPAYGYYPWGWYPPVSVRLGFGFVFHGGGFGGFRGRFR